MTDRQYRDLMVYGLSLAIVVGALLASLAIYFGAGR
jgi:hypothetical protein